MRILAALVLLAATLALGIVVSREEPPALDARISQEMQVRVGKDLGAALRVTSTVLYPPWNLLASLALALVVLALRGWRCALLVTVCTLGALGASYGLKRVYLRHRPPPTIADGGSVSSVHSYPSGHVAWTAAASGSLCACLLRRRRRALRYAGSFLAFVLTAWVAASRIYLERHWFTDTLGAALLATALVILFSALLADRAARTPSKPSGPAASPRGSGA